ncbi:hypothetical protein K437DRAFT_223278 [Tilletiaria anomala UBC 951]|uniref:RBR-type E3 ubiquitin transferase n=1 Tax=Tilletiaria anomala (strain ATCC 24038 / CBS 436.72 / UBC 951) TaxID=1037660 RepID=A0A066W380_TILAU|nr:uncharacterized protein K437DRAFT_223278 [Tilletiaria anomala UBC 951]KDN47003.1 hypothetical protein K437DRAFT_223278 [Tilletiaria anomala UBC 951]
MACKDRHWWDYDCLRTFVLAAMKDASVMPPKCEGFDIPEDSFLFLLTADERREYHTKHAEFIDKDPVFCTKTSCSLYLGTRRKRKTAITCLTCNERTCGACKAAWHGRDAGCTAPADNDVISKLRKGGIQRCPECRRMVERAAGCNKIWCICRALFCYECGASWKTCNW